MSRVRIFGPVLLLAALAFVVARSGMAQEPAKQPANVKVLIFPNAKLKIDNYETTTTGPERLFVSPPLVPGKKYTYTLKATWLSTEGRKIERMGVAVVEAGKEAVVDMRPGAKDASSSQIVYVPTPQEVVDKMLDMAKVKKDDIVFDLGCGDGRIVATAAKKFGAKGVGVDIDPDRIKDCKETLKTMEVPEGLVDIRQGDALKVPDLSRATVVMLYMLPEFMEKLKPIFEKELKPGTRIVAHDYPVPGWEPKEKHTVMSTRIYPHTLYLWVVGEKK